MESTLFTLVLLGALGLFMTLAYLAERESVLRWLVVPALAGLDGLLLFGGVTFGLASAITLLGDAGALSGAQIDEASMGPLGGALPQLAAVFLVVGLVGFALLLAPVRRLVARVLPIDPERIVHTAALHFVLLLVAVSGMIGAVMSAAAESPEVLEMLEDAAADQSLASLWVQSLGFVVIGLLGVGLFVSRDWRSTLERLGLTLTFSFRWWVGATVLGLVSGWAIDALWSRLQPETLDEVSRISDALFGPFLDAGVAGALTIGLSAGIGEEIVFRGAAQPRLGLPLTALLFAAIHTQYTVSLALVQMLIMGLLLGLVRRRVNTTTAIAVHATYNFILVMAAIYLPELIF